MMANKTKKRRVSTKEIIRDHLHQNRGREIPLSEIHTVYKKIMGREIGRTAISNAIKELGLMGEITTERRSLKHGRYTVIWLAGDNITERYTHPDEVNLETRIITPEKITPDFDFTTLDDTLDFLLSPEYEHSKFLHEITELNLTQFDLVTKYIQPLMYEVGTRWEQATLTTGQEHLITTRIEKIIHDLIPKSPDVKYQGIMLLCVVEGDDHVLNLLLLELLLGDRYKIINLGRSLPIRSLVQFITELNDKEGEEIDWIFISITLPTLIGTLIRQIQAIQATFGKVHRLVLGGQGMRGNEDNFETVDYIISSSEDLEALSNHLRN
ncbi:MAG: B12-binding domain-containing protein [Candidatus Kariarchaeaceae archaeon]|jgi:methanogenic corrinoid protein MtbC1